MTREQLIEILIQDRLTCYVYARNTDMLRELLIYGFKGFDSYTHQELLEEVEDTAEYQERNKK